MSTTSSRSSLTSQQTCQSSTFLYKKNQTQGTSKHTVHMIPHFISSSSLKYDVPASSSMYCDNTRRRRRHMHMMLFSSDSEDDDTNTSHSLRIKEQNRNGNCKYTPPSPSCDAYDTFGEFELDYQEMEKNKPLKRSRSRGKRKIKKSLYKRSHNSKNNMEQETVDNAKIIKHSTHQNSTEAMEMEAISMHEVKPWRISRGTRLNTEKMNKYNEKMKKYYKNLEKSKVVIQG
eukprot:207644_1